LDFRVDYVAWTIERFLGADPLEGEVALRDLIALDDLGEKALFAEPRPYPQLRHLRRRWLRYVASRGHSILERLLIILSEKSGSFDPRCAAFLIAGVADTQTVKAGILRLLDDRFDETGKYISLFEAWGYAGGEAGLLWDYVSKRSYLWEKVNSFAFAAACASFARANTSDAIILERFVTHCGPLDEISLRPEDPVPETAIGAHHLYWEPYFTFGQWCRTEVSDEILNLWSTHRHWRVRSFGAAILSALGSSLVLSRTADWLRKEPLLEVRDHLASALGNSGTEEGANILLEFVEAGRTEGANVAAAGLWRATDKSRAARALIKLAEKPSTVSGSEALVSLARLGQRHSRLLELLEAPNSYTRQNAAIACAYLQLGFVRQKIFEMSQNSGDQSERIMLATALAMLFEPSGASYLHHTLISGSRANLSFDLANYKQHIKDAVLAGFAASGEESRLLLEAWRAELAPLEVIAQPVFPSTLPTRGTTLNVNVKKSRYYVSYAWNDEIGPNREQSVDRLCQLAKSEERFEIIRDKNVLRSGDQISEFMKEIGEGDRVYVFLSEKYLRSQYCMFELFEMWRHSRADRSDFIRRVRLYPIDGVKFMTPSDWIQYAGYWAKERDKLEQSITDVGWTVAGVEAHKWWARIRSFAENIADTLALLADTVQTRVFEDFVKDGFAK
jgi:hypothetical protein